MKKNKIMALAMLCSTFLSPVSKAHGGTKQGTEKSDTLENVKNKKSDNPQEMYASRWKTDDIVRYIKYFFGKAIAGGGSIYAGKKGYEYIRKNLNINSKPKKVGLSRESVAKKIECRLNADISDEVISSLKMVRGYGRTIKAYQNKNSYKFQEEKQFIILFRELDDDTIDIVLKDLTNEEQKFAKDNFKFYSFVWVTNAPYIVIAFAPKEKKINLEGATGKNAENFNSKENFDNMFSCKSYYDILKYPKEQ